ncbi:MAG: AsnC family transcriptional regulator [Candidatus Bathyarchaeota archaeon]|nr:AsnC family transcriptional regulator [Candidatus Bathyarchaeota archaeon]
MQDQIRIDETDAKILKMLLKDARTSFTKIAQNCEISVGAARMRFAQLKKTGVITGEIMQVNPHILGYKCVADIGIITAVENVQDVVEFLKTKPYMPTTTGRYGKYTIGAIVVLREVERLSKILDDIGSNPKIKRVDAQIWVETSNMDHTENLAIKPLGKELPPKETKSKPTEYAPEKFQMDEVDRQIAKLLVYDARVPFSSIAKQVGISTKNVIQRYRRLSGQLLTLSTITVDLAKLGYKALAHVFIRVANRGKTAEIHAQLLKTPNLMFAVRLIGTYDLKALIALNEFNDLFELTNQVHKIQGIDQADIFVVKPFKSWPLNIFASLI